MQAFRRTSATFCADNLSIPLAFPQAIFEIQLTLFQQSFASKLNPKNFRRGRTPPGTKKNQLWLYIYIYV